MYNRLLVVLQIIMEYRKVLHWSPCCFCFMLIYYLLLHNICLFYQCMCVFISVLIKADCLTLAVRKWTNAVKDVVLT